MSQVLFSVNDKICTLPNWFNPLTFKNMFIVLNLLRNWLCSVGTESPVPESFEVKLWFPGSWVPGIGRWWYVGDIAADIALKNVTALLDAASKMRFKRKWGTVLNFNVGWIQIGFNIRKKYNFKLVKERCISQLPPSRPSILNQNVSNPI